MRTARFALYLLFAAFVVEPAQADEAYWQGVAKDVTAAVAAAVANFEAGDSKAARQALTDAYFGHFEDRKMEAAIRKEIGQDRAVEVEGLFGDLRKAFKSGDAAAVGDLAAALREALAADGKALDAAGVPPEVYEAEQ